MIIESINTDLPLFLITQLSWSAEKEVYRALLPPFVEYNSAVWWIHTHTSPRLLTCLLNRMRPRALLCNQQREVTALGWRHTCNKGHNNRHLNCLRELSPGMQEIPVQRQPIKVTSSKQNGIYIPTISCTLCNTGVLNTIESSLY